MVGMVGKAPKLSGRLTPAWLARTPYRWRKSYFRLRMGSLAGLREYESRTMGMDLGDPWNRRGCALYRDTSLLSGLAWTTRTSNTVA